MKKETKDFIEREVRFFMFLEKKPYHKVFHNMRWLMLIVAFLVPETIALGIAGMILLEAMHWLGILAFSTLIFVVTIEIPHYACDRQPSEIDQEIIPLTSPKYDWKHKRSALDEAESARAG